MRLMPRTLIGRMMLAFGGMMLLSYLATIILFFTFFTRPIADDIADSLYHQVQSIRAATTILPDDTVQAYLGSQMLQGSVYLQSATYPHTPPGESDDTLFQTYIKQALQKRLADHTEIRFAFSAQKRIVWFKLTLGASLQWLGVPLNEGQNAFPRSLFAQVLVIVVLTILGASWLGYRINRPIKQLVQAARQIGKGEHPAPLALNGPEEIQQLCATFNQMSEDIHKLDENRNLLLAGVSHDLRTPLARLRLAVEMLHAQTDETLRTGMIQDLVEMDQILGQFISYIRGSEDEEIQEGDINALINKVVQRYAQEGKIIETRLSELPLILFKPLAMQRVLNNLFDNAFAYGATPVEVMTHLAEGQVVLCVTDHGTGITESEIEHMTQPFTRQERARSNSTHAGLGLAIVKRIVQSQQGQLTISNKAGGGLKVCISLASSQ